MQYKKVPLNTLVPSPFNPPQRLKKTDILAQSILDKGLIVPIVVAKDMTIIDGHRRYNAFKKIASKKNLKHSEIVVSVIQHNDVSTKDYDKMFVAANEETMIINGNQYLWRYLKGVSIPKTHLTRIKWLENALGKTYATGMFNRILEFGGAANTYQMTMGVYCKYTGVKPTNHAHMRKLAYYLLNVDTPYRVKSSIAHFIPVNVLKKCITDRKKLDAKFTNTVTKERRKK